MVERVIKTVRDFLDGIYQDSEHSVPGRLAIYRGQCNTEWPLMPGIVRRPFDKIKAVATDPATSQDKSAERRLLIVLRDHGAQSFPEWVWQGSEAEVTWKQIVVAQHHGLPTRLLDWTTNPLVALYFAVEHSPFCRTQCHVCGGNPACVVGLLRRDTFSVASLARSNPRAPLYEGKHDPGLIRPPDMDQRIIAQSSIFSISKDPSKPIERDVTYIVPAHEQPNILRQLDRLGISRRTLFPDLDGLSHYLRWAVRYWEPNPGILTDTS